MWTPHQFQSYIEKKGLIIEEPLVGEGWSDINNSILRLRQSEI